MLKDGVYRAVRPALHRVTRNHVWTTNGGFFDGLRVRGGLGFRNHPSPITAEQRFLAGLPLAGRTVFDVGGFNGHLTWFFAQRARRVITFEPNPVNYLRVLETVVLNDLINVHVINAAVGAARGSAIMLASAGLDATGSLDLEIGGARGVECEAFEVSVVTIDDALRDARPDFVKVDVEGFEVEVLAGATATVESCHPDFQVEIHGSGKANKLAHAAGVIGWLWDRGYACRHVESGRVVTPQTSVIAQEGHIFATVHPS